MIRVIPNSQTVFVKRKGGIFIDVNGRTILTINEPEMFRHITEDVELNMAFSVRSIRDDLEQKLIEADKRIASAKEHKDYIVRRIANLEGVKDGGEGE